MRIRMCAIHVFCASSLLAASLVRAQSGEQEAYLHLYEAMDKHHQTFWVYGDAGEAGNHFVHLARMSSRGDEEAVKMDGCSTDRPYSGSTCIQCKFISHSNNWGGWYFQNGVLFAGDKQPRGNWGEYPRAGLDLTGARSLSFMARGAKGDEAVEFFALGVGWNPDTGEKITPFPDASPKVSLGYITLTKEWKKYEIDLTGVDLHYVLGGFAWATNAAMNDYQDIIFYLDDIQYHKSGLDQPRFLVSFETIPSRLSFDKVLKPIAFVYDNALALLAFTDRGTTEDSVRARLLAEAFVYAQNHDRYFNDGRLRNAYQAGDLVLPAGWAPNNRTATVRMPGWWDCDSLKWFEDRMQVGTHTGNMAWAMIALLTYYNGYGGDKYLESARRLGEWIHENCYDERGAGGYTGGYEGWEPKQDKLLWKATEHNLDVYVAFMRLFEATKNESWYQRAIHAKKFVRAMWNSTEHHFWTGTDLSGINPNKSVVPVDIQAWGLMALGETEKLGAGLDWAEKNCIAKHGGGFDFNTDKDGTWFEGTSQVCLAFRMLKNNDLKNNDAAEKYLTAIRQVQVSSPNANGKGISAASRDSLTTGFEVMPGIPWLYYNRLHIGATAWYIFALRGYNAFWDMPIKNPVPYENRYE